MNTDLSLEALKRAAEKILMERRSGPYCVYFIKAGPFIKIGRSSLRRLPMRLCAMETGCPYPMRVIGTIDGCDLALEKDLHNLFREHHAHREWFHDNEHARSVIDPICEQSERDELYAFHRALGSEPSSAFIEAQLRALSEPSPPHRSAQLQEVA